MYWPKLCHVLVLGQGQTKGQNQIFINNISNQVHWTEIAQIPDQMNIPNSDNGQMETIFQISKSTPNFEQLFAEWWILFQTVQTLPKFHMRDNIFRVLYNILASFNNCFDMDQMTHKKILNFLSHKSW